MSNNKYIYFIWYLGMGALAHWLWVGPHADFADMFTHACLLLGPFMVTAWLVMKAFWWVLLAMAVVSGLGLAWLIYGVISDFLRRRRRNRRTL